MDDDKLYMLRCLELAGSAQGHTSPNPMVGSVVVHDGKIIGEGYHRKAGGAHAEVHAINSVNNKELLKNSTLYVNLEPCCHQGKTPPCTTLLVQSQVKKVVIGSLDPNPLVAGQGANLLCEQGTEVVTGISEDECRNLNRRFYTFHQQKRPYIILKWAQTLDGFVDINREQATSRPTWITDESSRMLVHKWRSEEDAILVGTNTALVDNPRLDVRDWVGKNPLRLVLDRESRLNDSLALFNQEIPTIVYTEKDLPNRENLIFRKITFDRNMLQIILDDLYNRQVLSLFVEGGSKLLNSFISGGLWDEARVFIGNQFFHEGIKAPALPGSPVASKNLLASKLVITRKKKQH